MANVYTRRLASALFAGTKESVQLAVVPEGVAWVVRDIMVANPTLVEVDLQFWISNPVAYHLILQKLAPGTMLHLELRQRMYTGEALNGYSSAGAVNCVITGYEFSLSGL